MDQVKKIMAQLYKQGFWIGCGIIAIASVAIGVMATLNVQETAKKQKDRIDNAIKAITPVSAIKDHPNTKTLAKRDEYNLELERRVYGLWKNNFDRQRGVLTWPIELETTFHNEIKNPKYLQPELILLTTPETELLSVNSRNVYRNYIVEELPKLAPIIDAKWHVDLSSTTTMGSGPGGVGGPPGGMKGGPPGGVGGPGGPGGSGGIGGIGGIGDGGGSPGPGGGIGGGGSSQVYDANEVVAWDASSQQMLATKVLRGNSQGRPSTLDILYAQEDLWIVKALLNVIKKTNGNALERHRAPIKEIRTLLTGRDAGSKMGGIKAFAGAAAAPAEGSSPVVQGGPTSTAPVVGKPGAGGPPGGANPYGGGAGAAATSHPGDMRYVGADFQLKPVDSIKAAIESEAFDDATLAVAKRVPFRMLLVMDQRELSKFLVNCGNNDLMVEVSQVRINPQASTMAAGSPMGGSGGMPGAPGGSGGMPGAPGGSGGYGGKGGGAGAGGAGIGDSGGSGPGGAGGGAGTTVAIAGPVGLSPYDILVDIYGYVQIYNIPATKKFKHLEQAAGINPTGDNTANAAATVPAANNVPASNVGQPAATDTNAVLPANGGEPTASAPAAAGNAPVEGVPPAATTPPPADGAPPANGTPPANGAPPANP